MPEQIDASQSCRVTGAICGDELVVSIAGELDLSCREQITEVVRLEVEACPGVLVFDMAEVTFVDSSGLAIIVESCDTAKANGSHVVVRSPSALFRQLLEVSGVDTMVTIED